MVYQTCTYREHNVVLIGFGFTAARHGPQRDQVVSTEALYSELETQSIATKTEIQQLSLK